MMLAVLRRPSPTFVFVVWSTTLVVVNVAMLGRLCRKMWGIALYCLRRPNLPHCSRRAVCRGRCPSKGLTPARRCTGARAASGSWSVLLRTARTRSGARRGGGASPKPSNGRRPINPAPASPAPATPPVWLARSRASTATRRSAASAAEREIISICAGLRARSIEYQSIDLPVGISD